MNLLQIMAVQLTLASLAGYLNYRYLRLPSAIGLVAIALSASRLLVLAGRLGLFKLSAVRALLHSVKCSETLLYGMPALLMFAGALHRRFDNLKQERLPVAVLATAGVLLASFVCGSLFWLLAVWLGFTISFMYALLCGALISPTDPIAVLIP